MQLFMPLKQDGWYRNCYMPTTINQFLQVLRQIQRGLLKALIRKIHMHQREV